VERKQKVTISDKRVKIYNQGCLPKSVTSNDTERRTSCTSFIILPNLVALEADYTKVVEDRPILYETEI